MRWAVVVASPKGEAGDAWGDTYFGLDLVAALQRAGQDARVVRRPGPDSQALARADVVLVLQGLRPVAPRPLGATWMLWVISHPELVEGVDGFDAVFAASRHWSRAHELGATPLLQATDPSRFNPGAGVPGSGEPVLFVGSTRGQVRPIVRDAVEAGIPLSVYGVGWDGLLPEGSLRGDFMPNEQLPGAYASAGAVLNDHWPEMAAEGFLSNRLFDAVAAGANVISDDAVGLSEVFGESVRTYRTPADLVELLSSAPEAEARRRAAERIAAEHSFDARARVLVQRAEELRR